MLGVLLLEPAAPLVPLLPLALELPDAPEPLMSEELPELPDVPELPLVPVEPELDAPLGLDVPVSLLEPLAPEVEEEPLVSELEAPLALGLVLEPDVAPDVVPDEPVLSVVPLRALACFLCFFLVCFVDLAVSPLESVAAVCWLD